MSAWNEIRINQPGGNALPRTDSTMQREWIEDFYANIFESVEEEVEEVEPRWEIVPRVK